ncbi:MAG: protein DpdH [Polyangiaceae bacterium]
MRERLLTARENLEPELTAKHLILNISHRLQKEGEAAAGRIQDGRGRADDMMKSSYGNVRALPALIGDSELLHSHWLTREIDGSKGVMARLAEQITDDVIGPEDTRQHQIQPKDLELPHNLITRLNETSQRFYQALHSGREKRLEDAARFINSVLDPAKQDLLQLTDGSLTDLFRDVREQLFLDGKELVFLVEDFAVLSGLQGALLQVMITEAFRDGEQVLCTMRSALAYTEGVAHVPETVRTRARSLWTIEDQAGEVEDIHRRVVELVGAYLNAARVGQQGLRDALAAAGESTEWVPCVDGEDLEDETKAVLQAFGDSAAGHPLFPFNREAIHQLTEQGSQKAGAVVFNPRNVINNVLGRVLKERHTFERGRFPDKALGERLRSAEVTAALVRSVTDKEKQERALALLATWGDQPAAVEDAAAVPPALFTAFGLPQPTWGISQSRSKRGTAGHPSKALAPKKGPELPAVYPGNPKEHDWSRVLEGWGTGERLSQQHARQLRKWLAQSMLDFGPWGHLCLKIRHNADYLQGLVYLPRSSGQAVLTPADAFLVVASEEDLDDASTRAGVVRTLMAFVRLYEIEGGWNYISASRDAALCASFLESRLRQAEKYFQTHHFRAKGPTIPTLAQALLIGARALGVDGGESRQLAQRVNALFDDATTEGDLWDDTRWGKDLTHLASHRPVLREWLLEQIGARQGGRAVHAIDAIALEDALRETDDSWLIQLLLPEGENDPKYKSAAGALQALHRDLPRTLKQRRAELLTWHTAAVAWFGPDPDKRELRENLLEAINEASRVLPLAYDYNGLRRRVANLQHLSLKATMSDCARLEGSDHPGHVLSVLAVRPDKVVQATTELMDAFDDFLQRYLDEIDSRLLQPEHAVDDAIAAVNRELMDLRALLEELAGARV